MAGTGCGGGGGGGAIPNPSPQPSVSPALYQPLAVGNTWTYSCGPHPARALKVRAVSTPFPISDTVTETAVVNGVSVFALALQIPDPSGAITTQTELLANDGQGNTSIYGYLISGTIQPVTPAIIIGANPVVGQSFNYTGPTGSTVPRTLQAFTVSNPTAYGVFQNVAVYYENGGTTSNYGYVRGIGSVEQDHDNFLYDCTLQSYQLH